MGDIGKYPFWFRLVVVVTLAMFAVNLLFFMGPISVFRADDWLKALGTLVASFVGAWFAFRFARFQRLQDEVNGRAAAGNLALFTLVRMYNEVRQYQKEFVSPYRDKRDAWINFHIGARLNANLSFNVEDISFVMSRDAPTFADVVMEEIRFRGLADLVERHRELTVSEVWPRLEAAGLKIGESRLEKEMEEIVGPSGVNQLKIITSSLIAFTDENEKSLRVAFQKLRAVLKEIHPTKKFIDFKADV